MEKDKTQREKNQMTALVMVKHARKVNQLPKKTAFRSKCQFLL